MGHLQEDRTPKGPPSRRGCYALPTSATVCMYLAVSAKQHTLVLHPNMQDNRSVVLVRLGNGRNVGKLARQEPVDPSQGLRDIYRRGTQSPYFNVFGRMVHCRVQRRVLHQKTVRLSGIRTPLKKCLNCAMHFP